MERLNAKTLTSLCENDQLSLPHPPEGEVTAGIIHLGIGAFHRAHQALLTQRAMEVTGDNRWGIIGVTQRSDRVKHQLAPQDGLYAVLELSPEQTKLEVVGSVQSVLSPLHEDDYGRLLAAFRSPSTQVVSMTITEKGYCRDENGRLDLDDADVAADISAAGTPRSAIGRLTRGLEQRMTAGAAPITVVACDNLPSNGKVLRALLHDFCEALPGEEGEKLATWIDANVSFPCTMVDRIAPATADSDRALAEEILGLEDKGLVVAEPFLQWVIEDDFVSERPRWDLVGAQLTADVQPFEEMKLRVLNGTHSTLAYLGALRGYSTIAETVADLVLFEIASHLITEDVIPTLTAPEGVELEAYGAQVLQRFANPALAHKTTQVAMDGSQKIPQRLLGTVRDRLGDSGKPRWATLGVAAWMAYVASPRGRGGMGLPVDDPLAGVLLTVRGEQDPEAVVGKLLEIEGIFGSDLYQNEWFRNQLISDVADIFAELGAA